MQLPESLRPDEPFVFGTGTVFVATKDTEGHVSLGLAQPGGWYMRGVPSVFIGRAKDPPYSPARCALLALEMEELLKDNDLPRLNGLAHNLAFALATEGRGLLWTA